MSNREATVSMSRRFHFILHPASFILLLTACAVGLPPQISDPAKHPSYPIADYITATGMSERSYDDAEKLAQAKVAEQVRSRIDYQYEMAMSNEGIRHAGLVKKKTRFSHAEMIHTDTASNTKSGKAYYAFAYLPRKDVGAVLAREYESEAVTFRRAAQSTKGQEHDLPAFTASLRQAQTSFLKLLDKSFEINAVAGRDHPTYLADNDLFMKLENTRVTILRDLKLTVSVKANRADAREVVLMAVTGALSRLGVEATSTACDPQKYELRVAADVGCSRGSFGPQCKAGLTAVLVECASGDVLTEMDLNSKDLVGVNTTDQSKALAQLYGSINADVMTPLISGGVKNVLPIDLPSSNGNTLH